MKLKIWLALIAVYITWGSTYLAIRFAVATIPPFLMAGGRFLIAGAILLAWRRLAGDTGPTRIQWRSAAIVGLFLLLGGNGGVAWAEQRVASGIAALIVGSAPLFMVLIDALRPGGERPNWQTGTGVIVGFLGIALLISPAQWSGNHLQLDSFGVAVLMLSSVFWAVGSLYSRNAQLPESPLMGTGMEMLAGSAGLLVVGTLTGEWSQLHLAAISPASLWGMLYLITFGSFVGFACYTWLLRVAPTPLVSTYAYVNPLIAILLGSLLAKEVLTPRLLIAALVILSAVALINTGRIKRAASTRELAPSVSPGDR
jgi:drug/metabolite transporter (DMT)-like permease